MTRYRAARAFGWQIDYRPDAWLPLGAREGKARGWHVLPLGRFGCATIGRIAKPPTSRPLPCLGHPRCALTLGFQWCTCYSPALAGTDLDEVE